MWKKSSRKPRVTKALAASQSLPIRPGIEFEELEPRLLMSADIPIDVSAMLADASEQEQLHASMDVSDTPLQADVERVREVVLVDTDTPDYQTIVDNLTNSVTDGRRFEIVALDNNRDGVEQITELLAGYDNLDAVHIISHGENGSIDLGASRLDGASLGQSADAIEGWASAFAEDGDILIYGCNLAATSDGQNLVARLANITGAEVAASDDLTASVALVVAEDLEGQLGVAATEAVTRADESQQVSLEDSAAALDISLAASDELAHMPTREIVFVDSDTDNYQQLVDDLLANAGGDRSFEVVILDNSRDGIEQISEVLAFYDSVDAVHIISHGSDGAIDLGATRLDMDALIAHADAIAAWAGAFSETGDLLIYGCNLAATAEGETFVDTLARLTETDVAASDDLTGNLLLGGDWDLEYHSGVIESAVAVSAQTQAAYENVLDAPVLDTTKSPTLAAQAENSGVPSGVVGTLVSALVDFANPAGQVDNVTDIDSNAVLGIAVTGSDTTNGSWHYTTDNGTNWLALGAASDASALLLAADANTRLYFQPNADSSGTLANAISFRAWDTSSGTAGSTVDLGVTTMSDQFSSASYGNNDGTDSWSAAWVETDEKGKRAGGGRIQIHGGELSIQASAVGDSIYREVNLLGFPSATLSFNYNNVLGSGDTVIVQASSDGGASFTTLSGGTFSSALNTGTGSYSIDLTPYAAANTQIRFYVSAEPDHNELLVDNVQITGVSDVGGTSAYSLATDTASQTITASNDAPTASATATNPTYTEGDAAVDLFGAVNVDTVESGQTIEQIVLTVTNVTDGSNETITIDGTVVLLTNGDNDTTVSGYDYMVDVVGNTATITIDTNGASTAAAESLIDGLGYLNSSQNPTAATRVVTITGITDSGGGTDTSNPNLTSTVNVHGVNDAGVVTTSAGAITYNEQAAATVIDGSVTLIDIDGREGVNPSDQFVAAVQIIGNYATGDILGFSDTANIQGNFLGDTLVLSVIGGQTATVAEFEAALRSVTFYNGSESPGNLDRTIAFSFDDSIDSSNVSTKIVQVMAVNDAPVLLAGSISNLTVLEDSGLTSLGFESVAFGPGGGADESGQTLTYAVTAIPAVSAGDVFLADGTTRVTTGAYSLAQIQGMQFKAANDWNGVTAFQFNVTDFGGTANGGSDSISHFILTTVNPDNDAPDVDLNGMNDAGNGFAATFTEDGGAVAIADADALVSDVDSTDFLGLSLNVFNALDGASEKISVGNYTFTIGSAEVMVRTVGTTAFNIDFDGSGFSISKDGGGVIPLADMDALIRGITYENISQDPTAGNRTFDFSATDAGGVTGATSTSVITVNPQNDNPTVVGENYNAFEGVPYTAALGLDDLLQNDGDVEGDTLTVNTTAISGPANGDLILNADGTFIYTANDNFNGIDTFVYEVLDGNGGATQATATITVAPREVKILFATSADVSNSRVTGIDSWESGEILGIGDPNLSFEPVGSDGSVLNFMDLENFSADGEMVLNGLHYVGISSLTVGSTNSVTLQQGDILFVSQNNEVMTSTNSLAVNAGDVVVFRADVAGDYSAGTFIHLLDQPGASLTTGISLVEKDVLVGDVTLQAGTFIFTQEGGGAENSIYHFSADDVGAGTTTGSVSTLISSLDIGVSDNSFVGLMLVSDDLYLDGITVAAGSIITTLESKDTSVGTNTIGIDPDELFFLSVSTTTMSSGTTSAAATVLFDGGDIGLNNVDKKIRAFTIVEEFHAPNIDAAITLSASVLNYTEGDTATIVDAGITLADPDSTDFDGALLLVDLDVTGTLNDRLAIFDEGVAPGQIGLSGTTVTYGGLAIGTFAGGSDGTVPLTITFNANADVAAIEALLRNITYENVSTNPDTNQRVIEFTLTDGDGGVSDMVAMTVVVDNNNAAPVLSGANNLSAIGEDAVGNGGTLVSALIAGQVSDADPAALTGIAVIDVDNTNGDWQFSIDNGTTWTAFGSPDANNARLLADTSLVRFVPDANWNGTVNNGITFHAWDQTDGVIGGVTDITGVGNLADNFGAVSYNNSDGNTAWTSDWMEFNDDGNAATGNIRVEGGMLRLDNADGGAVEYAVRSADLSRATTADLTIYFQGYGAGSTDTINVSVSSDGGSTWTTMRQGSIVGSPSGVRVMNIESYTALTDDMQFKFGIVGGMTGVGEYISFDNIDIAYSGPGTGGSNSVSLATASSSITVNPIDDAAIFSGAISYTGDEGDAVGGSLSATDVEGLTSGSYFAVSSGATHGAAAVHPTSGAWSFTPTDANWFGTDSFEVTVTDDLGGTTTQLVTITLANVDDAPLLGNNALTISEGGTVVLSGTDLSATDVETTAGLVSFTVSGVSGGQFELVADPGNAVTTFTQAQITASDVQFVHDGGEAAPSYNVTVSDGALSDGPHAAPISFTNVNDAPTAIADAETVLEGATVTIDLALNDTDPDNALDLTSIVIVGAPSDGSIVINGDGTVDYTHNGSETLIDSFTYTIKDVSGATSNVVAVALTITPQNDISVITGIFSGAVLEGNVGDAAVTAAGTLNISDADPGDSPAFNDVNATLGDNSFGSFTLTAGAWIYTLDQAAVQNLDAGDVVNDTITYTATDGSTQQITVAITGSDDDAIITGTVASAVLEGDIGDAPVTATGSIAISDVDGDDAPVFNNVAATLGDNSYGSFTLTSGTWTYTLDQSTVQNLDAGDVVNDTITYTATDGST